LFAMVAAFFIINSSVTLAQEDDNFMGWFKDQRREVYDGYAELKVIGTVPDFVRGFLIRLGPTVLSTDSRNYTNFIDGFGRISKWHFDPPTTVKFQSAIIKSNLWNASADGTDIPDHIVSEKTEPPFSGVPDLSVTDNTDVMAYRFPGSRKLLTFTDFAESNVVDVDSLRALGNAEYNDAVSKAYTYSGSHYAEYKEPLSNSTVIVNWLGKTRLGGITLSVFLMGADMKRRIIGSTDVSFTPYSIHSLQVAGDYVFIVVSAAELNVIGVGVRLITTFTNNINSRIYLIILYQNSANAYLAP